MKKYKVRAEISGWATVSCSYDDLDDEERDEYLENMDCGDYDYSAGNSGASLSKEVIVKIKAPDDMPTDSKEFRELVEDAAFGEIDSGNLDILDGENDLDNFEIL
jgi:hypothetical protein